MITKVALSILGVFVIIILAIGISKIPPPQPIEVSILEPTNYVVDDAGVLKKETIDSLNTQLKDFEKGEIAVLLVKTTWPLDIEQYGIAVGEKWKVGHEGKDDGVILILATKDRKARIEVGRGAEGSIPDAVAGRILDEAVIPSLKNNDWDSGVINGVKAIQEKL